MEIRSPLLKRCICQIDFDLNGSFLSTVGEVLQVALRDKKQWNQLKMDAREQNYVVRHTEKRHWLFVEPKRVRYMCNYPKNGEYARQYTVELLEEIISVGKWEAPTRIGSRNAFLMLVSGAQFGDINERFSRVFLTDSVTGSLRATGLTPRDTGLVFDFDQHGYSGHLEMGPVSREQIALRFEEQDPTKCPKLSYIVDFDYAANRQAVKQFPDIATVILESLKRGEALSAKLLNQLKGASK